MTKLEKYLRKEKHQFDLQDVNPNIWLNIENDILRQRQRKNQRTIRLLTIAAAVAGILILVPLLLPNKSQVTPEEILANYDLESHNYPQLIYAKLDALQKAKIPEIHAADFQILIDQLEFLDHQYQEHLKYIQEHGYQQYVGKQLSHYYETKIELLDKIQTEVKKINKYEHNIDQDQMVELKF